MSVKLDIESQCESLVLDEGHTIKVKKDKWRIIRRFIQASNAFAATTTNRIPILTHDIELPLLSDQVNACSGDEQLPNISTSLEVCSNLDLNEDNEKKDRDKEQQYENISMIVKNRDLNSLIQFGGVKAFAEALGTDLENGLLHVVDQNFDIQGPSSAFLSMLKDVCNKKIIFLILLCGFLLVVFGIVEEGWETGWYQGVLLICAIFFLMTASFVGRYWSLCFLNIKKRSSEEEALVDGLREGQQCKISNSKVALGDIVCLSTGNDVPADGLFIRGESLVLDEESQSTVNDQNPFMFCGANVINGSGHMLVTSIGKDTVLGELMSAPTKKSSFHLQLDKLNTWLLYIALLINIFLIIVDFLRFIFGNKHDDLGNPDLKGKPAATKEFIDAILEISRSSGKCRTLSTFLTMILVGFSEGMPLIVTLSVGYWNRKATSDKASSQDFMACLTAGSVTAICTDIVAELTLIHEELDIYIGAELISEVSDIVPHVRQALCDGIRTLLLRPQGHMSLMEQALQSWACIELGLEISAIKEKYSIMEAEDEVSGALISKKMDSKDDLDCYCNGPAAEILERCSHYYDSTGTIKAFDGREQQLVFENVQVEYPQSIAFAYKQVNNNTQTLRENGLIFLGMLGLRHSFRGPMKDLMEAGVTIILVSKYSETEIKTNARLLGLVTPNMDLEHPVVLGDQFRSWTHEQRIKRVDDIHILANALPSDKLLMVKCLKEKAHRVVMVGVASDDMPSMLEADVGITMEGCSTKAVKNTSKIVISQGNFSTLLIIMKFGRCAHENIQKFIRIELTMATAWLLLNTISTGLFGDSPISTIQFSWLCLLEPIFGGLALLTMAPNDLILKKPPKRGIASIVTRAMWKSIVLTALYQTGVLVIFQYKGPAVLGISQKVAKTMIFNSFVLCQIFNWFNAREMEGMNVLSVITLNGWFWVAVGITVALQEIFTETAHIVTTSARLNNKEWGICFLIGGASCVIDWFEKCISELVEGWILAQLILVDPFFFEFISW